MQEKFTIEIAGLIAQVQPMFVTTREYCRRYLTDRQPEIDIEVTPSDLVFEQQMAEKEAVKEGLRIRKFTGPFLERASIQRRIALELLKRDTLLVHGSTVSVDGAAYLFTAPCGTGKSTHTRLWREAFGDRAIMVNDDKPFLSVTPAGIIAYGSPWSGKHGLDNNLSVPLKGICFLSRGTKNYIQRVDYTVYLQELIHQSFLPEQGPERMKAMGLVEQLAQSVPLWQLECTKDISAAYVSFEAMSGAN